MPSIFSSNRRRLASCRSEQARIKSLSSVNPLSMFAKPTLPFAEPAQMVPKLPLISAKLAFKARTRAFMLVLLSKTPINTMMIVDTGTTVT